MCKPTKAAISAKLEEWATLAQKKARVEARLEKELEPLGEAYMKKCQPFEEAAQKQLKPIESKLEALECEISDAMKLGIGKDGKISLPQVATDTAIAELTKDSKRKIKPEDFFKYTPAPKRNAAFWACVSILVMKAEKYLGSAVDKMSEKKTTYDVDVSLVE